MPPSSPRRSSLWPTNTSKASGSFCERFRGAALFSKSLVLFWTQLSFLRRLKTRAGFQPLRAPFSSAIKTASELAARKSSGQGKCGIGLRRGILAERLEASFFLNKNPRSHKRNGGSCLSEGKRLLKKHLHRKRAFLYLHTVLPRRHPKGLPEGPGEMGIIGKAAQGKRLGRCLSLPQRRTGF